MQTVTELHERWGREGERISSRKLLRHATAECSEWLMDQFVFVSQGVENIQMLKGKV